MATKGENKGEKKKSHFKSKEGSHFRDDESSMPMDDANWRSHTGIGLYGGGKAAEAGRSRRWI